MMTMYPHMTELPPQPLAQPSQPQSHQQTKQQQQHQNSNAIGSKGASSSGLKAPSLVKLPPRLLGMYDEFITKNAGSVGQIESALRSLTYVIPGRFRDAEIASETLHSGIQLLSLYHDALLRRVSAASAASTPSLNAPRAAAAPMPNPHARYTKYWTGKSAIYRRVALLLQMVKYTELLCEMTAKRRGGEKSRWRVVVILEVVKAVCRLILLRVTRSRPLLSPVLPERENITPIPEDGPTEEDQDIEATRTLTELLGEDMSEAWGPVGGGKPDYQMPWEMPRTGMRLPSLPNPTDISTYLLDRVLTADDIKPAPKLMHPASTPSARAAEVLHILAPLIYAVLLARAKDRKKAWHPWIVGLLVELSARHLRDRGLRTTGLESDEWKRRAWAMGWWGMRGVFYESVMKNVVGGVKARVPRLVGGILEDYEYLWENYYFSTSA
ncbi:Peroxisomal membrane protein PEX16 [Zalerion maritima]|uniref:Peroxisomal membrane protein PEX16 n=1 Tax=Zalerion maritima TaxID=339359 RepID=A0AAD5WXB7_9PEZI|nr:Peroxisomal membrane protein PEX16 [Zalerion maritima]